MKKVMQLIEKYGLPASAFLALIGAGIAFVSLPWAIAILGLSVAVLAFSLFVTLRRLRQSITAVRRGSAGGVSDPVGLANLSEPNIAILRELHLSTLEEVRMLKAEIAQMLNHSDR